MWYIVSTQLPRPARVYSDETFRQNVGLDNVKESVVFFFLLSEGCVLLFAHLSSLWVKGQLRPWS